MIGDANIIAKPIHNGRIHKNFLGVLGCLIKTKTLKPYLPHDTGDVNNHQITHEDHRVHTRAPHSGPNPSKYGPINLKASSQLIKQNFGMALVEAVKI